jgi:hypothetical protein
MLDDLGGDDEVERPVIEVFRPKSLSVGHNQVLETVPIAEAVQALLVQIASPELARCSSEPAVKKPPLLVLRSHIRERVGTTDVEDPAPTSQASEELMFVSDVTNGRQLHSVAS